jgi:small-conductance mechanosensitive channel
MTIVPKQYFKPAGRSYEIIIGAVCAAICLSFIVLTIWFAYRAYLVGNLFKPFSYLFIAVIIIFALGFFSLASRLFSDPANRKKPLLSNFVLYFMGILFLICAAAITVGIIYCKIKGKSFEGPAGYLVTAFLIGAGSITLANHRRKKRIQPFAAPDAASPRRRA